MKRLCAILSISLLCLLLAGCSERPIRGESFAMDTFNTITVYDTADEAAMQHCFSMLDEYERQWSAQREDSIITTLNRTGHILLQGDTAELLQTSLAYAQSTEGAFDPVIYPITSLWHIMTRTPDDPLPDEAAIAAALALTSVDDVRIEQLQEGLSVTLKPGMGFDFGAIAKGFAADKLKAYLLSEGVENAIISLGGNVCLVGDKTRSVGLEDPRVDGNIFGKLSVGDVHVVTSGDYQRYIMVDGKRIHHIFDPNTGLSANNGVCSVTIIGPSGAQCDALSTAVFVLGVERGLALAKAQGVDAVLVCEDGRIYMTEGAKKVFTLVNTSYSIQ